MTPGAPPRAPAAWTTHLGEARLPCCGHGLSSHCTGCGTCHAPALDRSGACGCETLGGSRVRHKGGPRR